MRNENISDREREPKVSVAVVREHCTVPLCPQETLCLVSEKTGSCG